MQEIRIENTFYDSLMEQAASWETDSHLASQDISYILWNLKMHYPIQNTSPSVPILSHMNPIHVHSCLISILVLKSLLLLRLQSDCFVHVFPTNILCGFLFFTTCVTFSGHLILFDFTDKIIFG
jgi:hypothetical protein